MAPQDTPSKKKRKIGRPRVERVQHVIEIQEWRWDYMFGVAINTRGATDLMMISGTSRSVESYCDRHQ